MRHPPTAIFVSPQLDCHLKFVIAQFFHLNASSSGLIGTFHRLHSAADSPSDVFATQSAVLEIHTGIMYQSEKSCWRLRLLYQCLQYEQIEQINTYKEQPNKGHIYRTISHVCHNKIICPLGS